MEYKQYEYPVNLLMEVFPSEELPDHTAAYFSAALERALASLPERNRLAVVRRYQEKMTFREIGETFGVGSVTARNLVLRGLRILRYPRRRRILNGDNEDALAPRPGGIPIIELDLSVRAYNGLRRGGIDTMEQLLATPPEDLLKLRNLGPVSYGDIVERLGALGYDTSAYGKLLRR